MTPDTLPIDRTFKGVGRIKKASGTTNPVVRNKINRMLTALSEDGRHIALLKAIKRGEVPLLEALDAYTHKTLDKLATGETARQLDATMEAWIDSLNVPADCSAKHKASLQQSRKYLKDAKPKAIVADLPALLEGLRVTLGGKHARSFNLARSAAQAFVRSTLKRSHPLWLAVAAVEPRKQKPARKHNPLSLEQFRNLFHDHPTDHVELIAWGMVLTGMGAEEYWGEWRIEGNAVHIVGTKRKGRVRDVPLVHYGLGRPMIHRRTFENKVRARTRSITVYDIRRTYAHWLEMAGVPRSRRKLYLGHGSGDVTGLYEIHEVRAFLQADAERLRVFLGLATTIGPTVRLVKANA